ncbi:hypothetical protein L218DRAFT_1007538 [Marasmius fiardii PR-910]|nr:hypothetical protein L218DRAFT_1007538 [Marasmius fiardii PR-910]
MGHFSQLTEFVSTSASLDELTVALKTADDAEVETSDGNANSDSNTKVKTKVDQGSEPEPESEQRQFFSSSNIHHNALSSRPLLKTNRRPTTRPTNPPKLTRQLTLKISVLASQELPYHLQSPSPIANTCTMPTQTVASTVRTTAGTCPSLSTAPVQFRTPSGIPRPIVSAAHESSPVFHTLLNRPDTKPLSTHAEGPGPTSEPDT